MRRLIRSETYYSDRDAKRKRQRSIYSSDNLREKIPQQNLGAMA